MLDGNTAARHAYEDECLAESKIQERAEEEFARDGYRESIDLGVRLATAYMAYSGDDDEFIKELFSEKWAADEKTTGAWIPKWISFDDFIPYSTLWAMLHPTVPTTLEACKKRIIEIVMEKLYERNCDE